MLRRSLRWFCTLRRRSYQLPLLLAASSTLAAPIHAPVPGGIAVIELPAGARSARFQGVPVLVIRQHAYVGLPLITQAGDHLLELDDGRGIRFVVSDKSYPTQHVRIKDKGKVNLSPHNQARVAREHAEIQSLKRTFRHVEAPDIDFTAPADGPLSGRFGVRRIFNGQPRAPHVGLDFSVPAGTPIGSAGAGTVLATNDYFFNGRTVYVDHGQGLITMYCHLEQIDVMPGQTVSRGQLLGRAGSTGRASGPHLHWSVILNGTMVDPEQFLTAP